jgi:hypothetical protein
MEISRNKLVVDVYVEARKSSFREPYFKFDLIHINGRVNSNDREDLDLYAWELNLSCEPIEIEEGDILHLTGEVEVVGTKYWTDCGYEYDCHFENDDVEVRKLSDEEANELLESINVDFEDEAYEGT